MASGERGERERRERERGEREQMTQQKQASILLSRDYTSPPHTHAILCVVHTEGNGPRERERERGERGERRERRVERGERELH